MRVRQRLAFTVTARMNCSIGSDASIRPYHIFFTVSMCHGQCRQETHPSIDISLRSPPKYRAYSLDIGSPYPNPAMGALKSLLLKSGSIGGVDSTVVYMYVQTSGIALRGIPPPSSEILIVISWFH